MARRSRRKKAARSDEDQTSSANAAHLTLLGLPVEIRTIILRLVIGDQLVHVFKDDQMNYDSDGQEIALKDRTEWILARSTCVAGENASHDTSASSCCSSPPTTSARDPPLPFHQDHEECWAGSMFDFEVFQTNRQIYQEAFALFWGTSRFCFEEGDVLKKLQETLNEAQRTRLKHIVLDVDFVSVNSNDETWDATYWAFRREWPVCRLHNASLHPLRSLERLELHLQLRWVQKDYSRSTQLGTIQAVFKVMANWRLLHLKQACVTVSYADGVKRYGTNGQLLVKGELVELAQSFRRILLDPTVTEEDQAGFLTYEIQDLEDFLIEQAKSTQENLQLAEMFQGVVRRGQVITEDVKGRLTNMRAMLESRNGDEMHNLLMSQEKRPQIARVE